MMNYAQIEINRMFNNLKCHYTQLSPQHRKVWGSMNMHEYAIRDTHPLPPHHPAFSHTPQVRSVRYTPGNLPHMCFHTNSRRAKKQEQQDGMQNTHTHTPK